MFATAVLTGLGALLWATTSLTKPGVSASTTNNREDCKCLPSDPCWPTQHEWHALNASISGQLIRNHPVPAPCYPGPLYDKTECASREAQATNNTFLQQFPVGYSYPIDIPCPFPSNTTSTTSPCRLGSAPIYTVNATCVSHIQAGLAFARKHNLRLVVRDTGHDLLGRSEGHGALQVWIRGLRTGVEVLDYEGNGEWRGKKAVRVGGGYVWGDVYPIVASHSLLVVGGGTPSVGCLGGWMQGGGHSPATHDYGLGADQVLQLKAVLANGSLLTASSSENPDLFFALRGGGPGTYGIVVETVVKAYPTTGVVAQTLAFAPLTASVEDTAAFFTALTDLYQAMPLLAKKGWSGFGTWCVDCAVPAFGNFSTEYTHSFANFKKDLPQARAAFEPLLEKLEEYNGTNLFVTVAYAQTKTYAEYYAKFSGVEPPAGTTGSTSGRFLDEPSLFQNRSALEQTLRTVAGKPGQFTTNVVEFFGAPYGQIVVDGHAHPVSGVNPAWRSMIMNHIVARSWTSSTPPHQIAEIQYDVEYVKIAALKKLAPHTGTYMNEGNRLDPDWEQDFYGTHYARLGRIKREVDPEGRFYCPTCVGSEEWVVREGDGALCRVKT